jgi:hypothetical protein
MAICLAISSATLLAWASPGKLDAMGVFDDTAVDNLEMERRHLLLLKEKMQNALLLFRGNAFRDPVRKVELSR